MTTKEEKQQKQTRRERRWDAAVPVERLSRGRQLALRVVDATEDAVLVMHLAVMVFAVVAHVVAPTRVFLAFVAGHETFVRPYWLIESLEDGEYGMWPGIFAAMATDAVAMAALVVPAVLPFVIARHYIVRDAKRLKDVVVEFLGGAVVLFLVTYLVGSIAGTFFVLLAAGVAGAISDVGGLLAPVGSGIFMTDLLFATWMWWDDRAAAPRGMSKLLRLGMGAVAGAGLVVLAQTSLRVQPEVRTDEDVILFLAGEEVAHEGEVTGRLRRVTVVTEPGELEPGLLVAPRDTSLYAYGAGLPLFHARQPFFHGPPDELTWDDGVIQFVYELHPSTRAPNLTTRSVTLVPDPGKEYFDQFEHVVSSEDHELARIGLEVAAVNLSGGLWFGLHSASSSEHLYVLASGSELRLEEVGSVTLARAEMDARIERVKVVDAGAAAVVFADDRPVWIVDYHRPMKLGPAMARRPRLKPADSATLRCETFVAKPRADRPFLDPPF